jgi:hypothetical protein
VGVYFRAANQMLTDLGSHFASRNVPVDWDKNDFSSAYHPQTNGFIER